MPVFEFPMVFPSGGASLVGRIYRNLDDLVTPQPAVRDGCVFPDHAKAVYAALQGPKQIEWTEGSQIDFYDLEPQVSMAVALAVPHFSSTLGDD